MESSWSYDCGEKGFMLSNQTVTPSDFLNGRTQNGFTNWGLMKGPYSYDVNTMLLSSDQNGLENQGNLEVGFIRKQSSHDSLRNCLSSNGSGGGDVINMQTIASNAVSGDEESSSRLSNSGNSRDSSLIDLKLGRFGDNFNATIRMSCSDSPTPAKRVKACSLNSQAAFCQVYGCNKDLCSSKDYHKRHKVCDVHSKTAKVVVNGLEQRFCQQCSRFHLLGEFDDGKRSCRRRLAGHNERRRKPQAGRAARLLHAYNGSTSFICHDTLPTHTAPQKCNCPTPYGSIMKQCPSLNTSTMAPSELPACALSLLSSQPQSSNPFPHHNGDFFNGSADLSTDVGSAFNRGFFNGSEYVNLKDDDGATVDLLQHSSQLQRVEHQRQAVSVKQEDQTFCCL